MIGSGRVLMSFRVALPDDDDNENDKPHRRLRLARSSLDASHIYWALLHIVLTS